MWDTRPLLATHSQLQEIRTYYNKEDLWSIPVRPVDGRERAMEPYYLILRLPSEKKEEFVLLIPFTPSKKDNLAAWLAARSDPPNYGKLVVYNLDDVASVLARAGEELRRLQELLRRLREAEERLGSRTPR